jgi:hypothetical protein
MCLSRYLSQDHVAVVHLACNVRDYVAGPDLDQPDAAPEALRGRRRLPEAGMIMRLSGESFLEISAQVFNV